MKKQGDIEKIVTGRIGYEKFKSCSLDKDYFCSHQREWLRRRLRALVRKAEANAFKSGMEAATQNPQWRQYKPFLDQFMGKK